MGSKPLVWYCRPIENGIWGRVAESGFGAYTPCEIGIVVSISNVVLLGLCAYRIWLIWKDNKVKRYRLRSNCFSYMLAFCAACFTAEPLFRGGMSISILDLDRTAKLVPFEKLMLIVEALAWCIMLVMLLVETKIYICEFRWYIRFGIIYELVGYAVMLNLMFSMKEFYSRSIIYLCISMVISKVVFGIFLLIHVPQLDPYASYTSILDEAFDDAGYEALPAGEHVCPERYVNVFSREDGTHLFLLCEVAQVLWSCLFQVRGEYWVSSPSLLVHMQTFYNGFGRQKHHKVLWRCVFMAIIWMIWIE